jgi:manganese/zinc/iron transport system permease protein
MSPQIEIQLISVIVAIACAIPGVFLVLKKMSMMSDAITHTILLGIVTVFFMVHSLNSPFLILGAAIVGVLTFFLVEVLNETKLLSEDSSIGIVFPLLFSIAIIMISKYAGSVHLDTDSVLLGEIAFAPFNRMILFDYDIGAKALYTMGAILIVNIVLVIVFFKELKIVTFDKSLAKVLGFSPLIINYGLMASVSVTAVGAFEAVGSILVIAFMIGPPVSSYLLTDNLKKMLLLSGLIGAINGILGYQFATYYDVSIAGSMAMFTGITFLLIFIFAPKRGFITILRRRRIQKFEFAEKSMLFHIYNHEKCDEEKCESAVETIYEHLHWSKEFLSGIVKNLKSKEYIMEQDGMFMLTEKGRKYTINSYENIVSSF